MPRATDIAALAAGWLIRLEREATPELWEELQAWLEAHPRHRAEFIRQRTAWNRCDKLKMLRPERGATDNDLLSKIEFVDPDESPPASRSGKPQVAAGHRGRTGRRTFGGGVDLSRPAWLAAAAVAGLAILGGCYWALRSGWDSYRTAIGARQQIALSDGSQVQLNTNSELRVRMTATRRDTVLQRGEALFRVAHDAHRPFFVVAGTTVVRAVGTAFSVRIREDNRVEVLVTEGRVAVGTPGNAEQPTLSPSSPTASVGDDAWVSRGRVSVIHLHSDEVGRKLAWTAGHLAFQGETLSEAVGEFNRYNLRHLVIADAAIAHVHVGGTFSSTDPDSFVAALQHSFHVAALTAPEDNGVRLISAPESHSGDTLSPAEEPPTASPGHDPQTTQDSVAH